mmetsp:Transcript_14609/g.33383  ORF Transcript_14609/g.33383 Transcript_14609/m.33383 type:complete len:224 (-) Transcript_14609:658-1329(-)
MRIRICAAIAVALKLTEVGLHLCHLDRWAVGPLLALVKNDATSLAAIATDEEELPAGPLERCEKGLLIRRRRRRRLGAGSLARLVGCERRHHLGNAHGEPRGEVDVQELVRRVHVRAWPRRAGDEELRLWEHVEQHAHERDAAALPHVRARLVEEGERGRVDRLLQPRRLQRSVPPVPGRHVLERDPSPLWRRARQYPLEALRGLRRVKARRQPHRELERCER